MNRIPFNENEMTVIGKYPARGENPSMLKLDTPVTPRENMLALYRREKPLWIPEFFEMKAFAPNVLPENKVRGMVMETLKMPKEEFGGPDMFGVDWIFMPEAGGSMVRPGTPKVPDLSRWEEYVTLPDPDSWDWVGSRESNQELIEKNYGREAMRLTIYTGFFERLISWMDFEDAAVAMIDEDQKEDVHRVFSYLADLYIRIIGHVKENFPVDILQLHDDWGSQMAPFFSLDVVREMIVPHLKKVVDFCHEKGMFFDLHSCGMNKKLVPAMIEAGVDSWQPQIINDTWDICRTYGDQIIINVIPKNTPKGLVSEEYDRMAKEWVDDNFELFCNHPFILLPTPMDPFGKTYVDPQFIAGAYRYSREKLDH
ncbi:MAG: methyltransferase [Clostridiales bacterium]|nr:methyltransferase [Clostridiales bacterium]